MARLLFREGATAAALRLRSATTTGTGVVIATYERLGRCNTARTSSTSREPHSTRGGAAGLPPERRPRPCLARAAHNDGGAGAARSDATTRSAACRPDEDGASSPEGLHVRRAGVPDAEARPGPPDGTAP
jgi:hypothetical protein